jgi:uncharacterized membrane protein YsdA (DUF1294 family)
MYFNIFLTAYLIFNLYTFFLMAYDKTNAGKGKRRVSEARLFSLAVWGGSLGILIGMPVWRHKNRKSSFKRNIFSICAGQILLLIFVGRFIF